MSPAPESPKRAEQEAAQWFARLNAAYISTDELIRFRAWRRSPANDAAYAATERVWRRSRAIETDADVQAALGAAKGRVRRRASRALGWMSGLLACAAALAGLGALMVFTPAAGQVYQTAVGEQSSVVLEDGSRIRLDTNSRMLVQYSASERRITLVRGQAFFDVVHLPSRPLRVEVGAATIRDLGTRFDVRKDDGQVRITVVEGAVQVGERARGVRWTMTAGQQMLTGPTPRGPFPVDASKATSWTNGRLVFENMSLSQVAAEMNRYGRHRLILDLGPISEIKVSGAFDSTDTNAFVAAVSRLYDLKAKTQADGSIVLSAPATTPAS